MRGVGSKAVWNFSKNSSDLVGPPIPRKACDNDFNVINDIHIINTPTRKEVLIHSEPSSEVRSLLRRRLKDGVCFEDAKKQSKQKQQDKEPKKTQILGKNQKIVRRCNICLEFSLGARSMLDNSIRNTAVWSDVFCP